MSDAESRGSGRTPPPDDLFESGHYEGYVGRLKQFSLINSLLKTFNRSTASSPNGIISRYFLTHFEEFPGLNIYDVARDCFTSRSGIRRFAQSAGFENFSQMKSNYWEWDLWQTYFTDYVNHDDIRANLVERINSMFDDINEMVSEDSLRELADMIHDATCPVLLASDFSAMAVREFQQSMIFMHKLIRVISDSDGDESVLKTLDPCDVVIVISASGNFADAAGIELSECPARRVLVTLNRDAELAASYDVVYHLSRREYRRVRTVYSEYGIRYFFDLLYNMYFRLYGEKGERRR